MKPKTFSLIDLISSIVVMLFLLFLFIYPHIRIDALQDDIVVLCDRMIEDANNERWNDALTHAEEIKRRFGKDEKLLRMICDHEDVDNAADAIDTAILMATMRETTEFVIKTENIKGIVIFLAGIETLTMTNLF